MRRSGRLVQGSWWRVFALLIVTNAVAAIPGVALVIPLDALARSLDRELPALVGTMMAESLRAPFVALVATLLYYDLRVRSL